MSTPSAPHAYHWCQVSLHWMVAVLVAVQYATGGSIERTHHAVAHGVTPERLDLILHTLHNRVGLVILGLMLVRLILRVLIGVPDPPVPRPDWRRRTARVAHLGFYVVLIVQASTGAIASYLFWPISLVHVALSKMLLALIALHACAALWHFCIARDGTMERMLPWRRRRVASAAGPLAEQQSTLRLS